MLSRRYFSGNCCHGDRRWDRTGSGRGGNDAVTRLRSDSWTGLGKGARSRGLSADIQPRWSDLSHRSQSLPLRVWWKRWSFRLLTDSLKLKTKHQTASLGWVATRPLKYKIVRPVFPSCDERDIFLSGLSKLPILAPYTHCWRFFFPTFFPLAAGLI